MRFGIRKEGALIKKIFFKKKGQRIKILPRFNPIFYEKPLDIRIVIEERFDKPIETKKFSLLLYNFFDCISFIISKKE